MAKRLSVALLVFACMGYGTLACSGGGDGGGSSGGGNPTSPGRPLTVILRNSSGSAVHMFVGGESSADSNLVAAGGSLSRTFSPNDRESFNLEVQVRPPVVPNAPLAPGAGTSCRLSGSRNQTQVEVVYDGSSLRCVGW